MSFSNSTSVINAGTNQEDDRNLTIVTSALEKLTSFFILLIAAKVFLEILDTFKYINCSYEELSQLNECDYNFYRSYNFIVLLFFKITALPLLIYCVSSAGPTEIGFTEANQTNKWSSVATFFGYTGQTISLNKKLNTSLGVLYSILFVLTSFNTIDLFREKEQESISTIEIPEFLYSDYLYFILVISYVVLNIIVQKITKKEEKNFMKTYEQNDLPEKKASIMVLNVIYAFLFLITSLWIFFLAFTSLIYYPTSDTLSYNSAFILVASSVMITKNFVMAFSLVKQKNCKFRKVNFAAFFVFFEIHYVNQIIPAENENCFITSIVLAWIMVGYTMAYQIMIGRFKKEYKEVFIKIKKFFTSALRVEMIITTIICFMATMTFLSTVSDIMSYSDNPPYSYHISWCQALKDNPAAVDALTKFRPSASLMQYLTYITKTLVADEILIFAFLVLYIFFDFRVIGSLRSFKYIMRGLLLYVGWMAWRIDSVNDTLLGRLNFGFAEIWAESSHSRISFSAYVKNNVLFILMASSLLKHNTKNEESAERPNTEVYVYGSNEENLESEKGDDFEYVEEDDDNKLESPTPQDTIKNVFFCGKLFQYIILFFVVLPSIMALSLPWYHIGPKNFTFMDSNPDIPMVTELHTCTKGNQPADFQNFASSLEAVSTLSDAFNEDPSIKNNIKVVPFEGFMHKLALLVPNIVAIFYVLFSDLTSISVRNDFKMVAILVLVNLLNVTFFLGTFFVAFIFALQIPIPFTDMVVDSGFYCFLLGSFASYCLLAMHAVDKAAPIDSPSN